MSDMYKLAFIFLLSTFCNAKVIEDYPDDVDLNSGERAPENDLKVEEDTLWVLDIIDDDLNFNHLRSAKEVDNQLYREIMAPVIKLSKHQDMLNARNGRIHPKTNVTANTNTKVSTTSKKKNNDNVKKELYKMINKFMLSYQGDPSLNLPEGGNNGMSIKLYFKGPYTSLIISCEDKMFNYFLNPPSSLPRWFYEKHKVANNGEAMFVEVPDTVRDEFYEKFFYLLKSLFNFAV